jgi:hypothetical protein
VQAAACRALGFKFVRGYYGRNTDNSKKLFIIDFVIIFYRVKFVAYKSDRV